MVTDMEQEHTMIEKLYFGEISPHEYFCPRLDSLYRREMEELDRQEEKFRKKLPEDMLRAYNKLIDGRSVYSSMENEAYFAEGFRIGVRLMAEAYAPRDKPWEPPQENTEN